ncbi:CLUMA_CG021275, isoform A [Clunio marinus]|uniref:CLUMA_CG021275, isoform A n=1 Tax=Clunio marinus TaxID=568069 RepID=A0A1J1J806_9DIPT|nr:CLUMA_CG021275, isoform A [Clunio marinus]
MAQQPPPANYPNYGYTQQQQSPVGHQNGNQQQNLSNGYPSNLPPMKLPAAQQPVINYQNFQTKAIQPNPGVNGSNNSNLSSRTSSPGIIQQNVIPQSQLPPSRSYPSYQNLHQQQPQQPISPPSSQLSSTSMNNNNNIDELKSGFVPSPLPNSGSIMTTPNQQQQQQILSSSMKNLSINQGYGQAGNFQTPKMPSSKSEQNFLNNNNNNNNINSNAPGMISNPMINSPIMPPIPSKSNTINKRPMYPTQQPLPNVQPQQMSNPQTQQFQTQPQHQFPAQPQQQQQQQQPRSNLQYQNFQQQQQQQQFPGGIVNQGFNRMWGNESVDLMQHRHILPTTKVLPPPIKLNHQFHEATNCSSDIFRCTLTKIPESNGLLQKSRLPLGVLIHPYRDLSNLPVISCTTIVRCRVCRTYINPFVFFVDSKKWKCNLCYRVNELPEEFQYDPVSKTYGDPTRRPEVRSSTIEFIAPAEYMLRPPQPAMYLFLLDVSSLAQQSGYLETACQTIQDQLDNLPGDARAQVGFIAYNSAVHFYNIADGFNQPHEITVLEVDDVFLPCPDNLLVNLKECRELINDLLQQLPKRFATEHDNKSALGAALQAAFKLMSPTGGRVSVFQTCLPNFGPGALQPREDPNNRSSKDVQHLGPATDFYKRLALDCSGQQIAVDLFLLNSQYSDLATLSGISKFSGGTVHHFPLFNVSKQQQVTEFQRVLTRYLTRKIGFESVMRVRCTRGLSIHTFHGNFFVRSTDLLSLPNVNPDSGFGMQITYDESLADVKTVCFQAALLYTSSKAERRIRVHTICLPVTESLSEVMHSADQQCIVGLLSKMAVDRSLSSNLSDARDAFINATVDVFTAFKIAQNLPSGASGLVAPQNLALFPLYILSLLKQTAFRTGTSTRLDDRVYAMCQMKSLPLDQLIRVIYPDFFFLDPLFVDDGDKVDPPRLQLSSERLDSRSMFLMDTGTNIFIYVGSNTNPSTIKNVFGKSSVNEIPDVCYNLPKLETPSNEALHEFIDGLNEDKPYSATIQVIRDSSPSRNLIVQYLVDDRNENSLSYYEFLQHLRTQVSK